MATNQRDAGMDRDATTRAQEDANRRGERNPDAITGAPGSHPVGTGVGTASGGVAGAAVGAAIGSVVPGVGTLVGAAVGAAVGGTGGGLTGKAVAEHVNPTAEDAYWRENYKNRPYGASTTYDELAPAYRYGWESRTKYEGRNFDDVESDLSRDWDKSRSTSHLGWDKAKSATRDAWDRIDKASSTSARSRDVI